MADVIFDSNKKFGLAATSHAIRASCALNASREVNFMTVAENVALVLDAGDHQQKMWYFIGHSVTKAERSIAPIQSQINSAES